VGRRLEVELVGAANREKMTDLISTQFPNLRVSETRTTAEGVLFRLVMREKESQNIRDGAVEQAIQTISNRIDEFGVSEPTIQRQGSREILIQLPGVEDPERAKALIGRTAHLEFKLVDTSHSIQDALKGTPPAGVEVLYGRDNTTGGKLAYLIEKPSLLTGDMIADAKVRPASQLEGPYVELTLNSRGAKIFDEVTGENVQRQLAIILDNQVYSAPTIQERIPGGTARITGSFEFREARDLAIVLRTGALPAPVNIQEERTVGPSLGRDSIRYGLTSFAIGGSLVILFMVLYYKFAGLIADLALVFNVLFLLAALAAFQASLTLPGIAGIVLTTGMAVDANVLINERIREELRGGKPARSAVDTGYQRALPAILDSNITTFLAGLILFQFGSGPVRGFAVTLCIGIVSSVFTAVVGTRLVYDYRLLKRRVTQLSI
jgi:preprotein translocase subunit SecD